MHLPSQSYAVILGWFPCIPTSSISPVWGIKRTPPPRHLGVLCTSGLLKAAPQKVQGLRLETLFQATGRIRKRVQVPSPRLFATIARTRKYRPSSVGRGNGDWRLPDPPKEGHPLNCHLLLDKIKWIQVVPPGHKSSVKVERQGVFHGFRFPRALSCWPIGCWPIGREAGGRGRGSRADRRTRQRSDGSRGPPRFLPPSLPPFRAGRGASRARRAWREGEGDACTRPLRGSGAAHWLYSGDGPGGRLEADISGGGCEQYGLARLGRASPAATSVARRVSWAGARL